MFKRALFLLVTVFILVGCSLGEGEPPVFIDESQVTREFNQESGEIKLLVDADQTEMPKKQRPLVVFLVPNEVLYLGSYQHPQLRQVIEVQSEMGQGVLAAIAGDVNQSGTSCQVDANLSVTGCQVVMGVMKGMIGSCYGYPLAYTAAMQIQSPVVSESQVLAAVVIPDEAKNEGDHNFQVIFP